MTEKKSAAPDPAPAPDPGDTPPPAPAPDVSAAPPPPPASKGTKWRYTGGVAIIVGTLPPLSVSPGAVVTAASADQATFMSGHAEFAKEGADAQSA